MWLCWNEQHRHPNLSILYSPAFFFFCAFWTHILLQVKWNISSFKTQILRDIHVIYELSNSNWEPSNRIHYLTTWIKDLFIWIRELNYFIREFYCWLVVLKFYVVSVVFQPYCDVGAGYNQSLIFKWWGRESNPGPLAPQAKNLTTRSPPLPRELFYTIKGLSNWNIELSIYIHVYNYTRIHVRAL